jgi:hypothetical protein
MHTHIHTWLESAIFLKKKIGSRTQSDPKFGGVFFFSGTVQNLMNY